MGFVETLRSMPSGRDVDALDAWAQSLPLTHRNAIERAGLTAQHIMRALHIDRLSGLSGVHIIDIACGCDEEDGLPPFFPILAGINGAKAIGIDKGTYTGVGKDLYRHIIHDISEGPLDLREITGWKRCNVVTCIGLTGGGLFTSPSLLKSLIGKSPWREALIETKIKVAAKEILSPGGILVYNNAVTHIV